MAQKKVAITNNKSTRPNVISQDAKGYGQYRVIPTDSTRYYKPKVVTVKTRIIQ